MNRAARVMVLVDADNVSADVIDQAMQRLLAEEGAVHVRRAYCNAETALKQHALFKRWSMRPMVNLSAGKNSTDIALAVDATTSSSPSGPISWCWCRPTPTSRRW
ncbi:NYN domain-containing protein [Variovorax sp. J22P168]|uniref:NYN domain-containing protein n=1 Tax=Variovorax jilinensis TaxID=3053513 RepID=UPI002574F176|nr:NYN domain-containing protein [Variovorax sp. J22P168]MDM0011161.1 NYN domain-containing protein [Variovorax sp. J22P168]